MKASELRIGNIVKSLNPQVDYCFIDGINQGRVDGVRRTMDGSFLSGWNHGSPELEPILLTKEWLEKFGFKEITYSGQRGRRYDFPDDRFTINLEADGDHNIVFEGNGLTSIKYVHQLQNLYYALTGEELTIKEPAV